MMKRLILALALVAACKKGEPKDGYTSQPGGYSVQFPQGIKAIEEDVPDAQKRTDITWHEAKSDIGAYAVMYADFKDDAAAQQDIADYEKNMTTHGYTVAAKDIKIGSHAARELQLKVSDTAAMWIRLVSVGKRTYRVSAGTKNNATQASAFLDTFHLAAG